MPISVNIVNYFWEHVAICAHGKTCRVCCWPWTGTRWKGYGIITIYDKELYASKGQPARTIKASRIALEIATNAVLAKGTWALHACNNPPCCNTNTGHVYAGTPKKNTQDAIAAGTHISLRQAKGADHWRRKYPQRSKAHKPSVKHPFAMIQTIRHLFRAGFPVTVLARIFALRSGYVSAIVLCKRRCDS